MGNLRFNDDGSVTIPVRGRDPIVLEEPTMWELAEMHRLITEADEKMGLLDPLPADASDEDRTVRRKQLLERTNFAFSHESSHGAAMVEIIHMLVPDSAPLTERELPGWLCHPTTANTLLVHFRTPLPGMESSDETSEETS